MKPFGLPFLTRKRFGVAQHRLGIGDRRAALRLHEQAGGDDVVAAGLQAGDHRAVFGDRGDDFGNAEPLEDHARHVGSGARDLAVGRDRGEGRLVGDGDAGKALRLQLLELCLSSARRLGSATMRQNGCKRHAGMPAQNCNFLHLFPTPLVFFVLLCGLPRPRHAVRPDVRPR